MQEETLISLACMGAGCSGVVYDIQGGYGIISSLNRLGSPPERERITPGLHRYPLRGRL